MLFDSRGRMVRRAIGFERNYTSETDRPKEGDRVTHLGGSMITGAYMPDWAVEECSKKVRHGFPVSPSCSD